MTRQMPEKCTLSIFNFKFCFWSALEQTEANQQKYKDHLSVWPDEGGLLLLVNLEYKGLHMRNEFNT